MYVSKHIENNHPSFLIIPFEKEDIYKNHEINRKYEFTLKKKLEKRYPGKFITITNSGRKALELAINQFNNINQKSVRIQTTSDNFYISGCVTKTIEKTSRWHRSRNNNDDLILVNHEFGYADNRIFDMDRKQLIEDCAFAFASKFEDGNRCGTFGQYSIFSLSKFFPIQIGGFLLSDNPINYTEDPIIENYINSVVGYYFDKIDEWIEKRQSIYEYYEEVFCQLKCTSYFPSTSFNIPGVFLFRLPHDINAPKLKEYYSIRGVQCSVFYREQAFYLPLHQFTTRWHVDLFAELLYNFINNKYE